MVSMRQDDGSMKRTGSSVGVRRQDSESKEAVKMQLDVWSVVSIILVVIGFFGGIWYEHR